MGEVSGPEQRLDLAFQEYITGDLGRRSGHITYCDWSLASAMKRAPYSRCALYNVFEMPDKYTAGAVAVKSLSTIYLPVSVVWCVRQCSALPRSEANDRLTRLRLVETSLRSLRSLETDRLVLSNVSASNLYHVLCNCCISFYVLATEICLPLSRPWTCLTC